MSTVIADALKARIDALKALKLQVKTESEAEVARIEALIAELQLLSPKVTEDFELTVSKLENEGLV